MNFGRLADIIQDTQKEINTLMEEKNSQENQLIEKGEINTYIVSIFTTIKNKYPELTFNEIQNIFTRFYMEIIY